MRGEQTGGEPRETSTCLARVGPETVPPLCTVVTVLAIDRGPSTHSVCSRERVNSTPFPGAKRKPPQPPITATPVLPSLAISTYCPRFPCCCCSSSLSLCPVRPSSAFEMPSQVPAEAAEATGGPGDGFLHAFCRHTTKCEKTNCQCQASGLLAQLL